MSTLRPEQDGDPLPPGTLVFRISESRHVNFVAEEGGRALPGMFELSNPEKNSEHKRLSIWVEELTLADQAWDFMGQKPKHTIASCISAEAIRSLPVPDGFDALDAVWEKAKNADGTPNERRGAAGHSGIIGLHQGQKKRDREKRLDLRSRLADAMIVSPVPVPHQIPDAELQTAAYFISENREQNKGDSESDWIAAVRQLRRARVLEHRRSS